METQINTKTIKKIKKELKRIQKEILIDLENFAHQNENADNEHLAKFPEYGTKADDNAQEITDYSTNLATEDVIKKNLRDIENSLERIEDETYGICKYCKNPITEKRLLARPVASACVDCKTKLQNS